MNILLNIFILLRNFRDLDIWKSAIAFTTLIYKRTIDFPTYEKYSLVNQMRRAATSIPSNIAEGASRKSEKEFARFLEIAMGSSFELETQIIIATELEYLTPSDAQEIIVQLNIIQKQINTLITRLRPRPKYPPPTPKS